MTIKAGIWIDKREAKLVFTSNGEVEEIKTINSAIEEFHPAGGSGTRMKGGPQDVVQDSTYTEREKHQYKAYFKEVADGISDADAVVIFGPAQTGQKLNAELLEHRPQLANKVTEVVKADSMSDEQVRAWVRNYFNK